MRTVGQGIKGLLETEFGLGTVLVAEPTVTSSLPPPEPDDRVERFSLGKAGFISRLVERRDGSVAVTKVRPDLAPANAHHATLSAAFDLALLTASSAPRIRSSGKAVRVADLFSGCGAMSLGVAEACRALGMAFVPSFALDMNESAIEVYEENFPVEHTSSERVELLLDGSLGSEPTKAERGLKTEVGRIEVLLGGPPCQGHSDLNNHTRGDDDRNALYAKMARFADVFRPKHIIIENVKAVQRDKGKVVAKTRAHLEGRGYSVAELVLEASSFGVPQTRSRHFLVASRKRNLDGLAAAVRKYQVGQRSAWWAIGDLKAVAEKTIFDTSSSTSEENRKRIEYLFEHDAHDLPDPQRPECHRLKSHTYKSIYGRIYQDRPAQTITTGFGSMGQGRFVHPTRPRTITPHEAARLQFIPDWFDFSVVEHRSRVAELIGNAVPPKLSYVLALELLR